MKSVKTLQLKKLDANAKECIYKKLLKGDYKAEITVLNKQGKPFSLDIDFMNNDCCINSWSLNFYCRTNKAVKNERYKTLGQAITALKRLFKSNLTCLPCSNLRIYNDSRLFGTHIFSIDF